MNDGGGYFPSNFRTFIDPSFDDRPLIAQNHQLAAENAMLRADMARREEAAYEYGLGDAAKVYRENRILAATIAALIDRQHPLAVRTAASAMPTRTPPT